MRSALRGTSHHVARRTGEQQRISTSSPGSSTHFKMRSTQYSKVSRPSLQIDRPGPAVDGSRLLAHHPADRWMVGAYEE
jgi:hypothetical protein